MVGEGAEGHLAARSGLRGGPEVHQVVVRSGSEDLAIRRIGQPAHFLGVADARADGVVADADVVVDDRRIATRRRDDVRVPREGRDARRVAVHAAQAARRADVPQFGDASCGADREVARSRLARQPRDRADVVFAVAAGAQVRQLANRAVRGIPDVHRRAERHGDAVVGAPLDQIQVVVVEQVGRVEHARRRRRYVPRQQFSGTQDFPRRAGLRRVQHSQIAHVALRSGRRLVLVVDDARVGVVHAAVRE
mmetsp:Transcript_16758/g.50803  ORF Transcript_16758/g.50803 Transcript_16758/m.50803 type:complete len:250 (-) Transcript_16758:354-1103(-)